MNPQLQIMLQQAIQAFQGGNFTRASSILVRIIQGDSKCLPALHVLGLIKASQANHKEAANFLGKAARLNPNDASIQYNLAKALADSGSNKESISHHKRAVELAPNNPEAYLNYGKTLSNVNLHQEALLLLDKAILINPNYAEAWLNRGNTLHELKQYNQAIESFVKAISINPNFADAYYNLGITQQDMHLLDEAIISFKKSISLNYNAASARWNLALCYLIKGNLEDGFVEYESRWDRGEAGNSIEKRSFDKPLWLGVDSLQGKAILLYGEQGLGDFIHFCRYVKLVADLGAKVILEVPPPLAGLMRGLEGASQLAIKGEKLPSFDYQCPLLSLPLAFKTNLHTIPDTGGYLNLDRHPNKIMEWNARLGVKSKPRVGLVWSGNPQHKNDYNRSLLLRDILSSLPNQFEYISLQKEVREVDKLTLDSNSHILTFASYLNDLYDTAALIHNLDLVISVDTSVAHLSGALGKKTWVLLPHTPDWRWLLDRVDSPWYLSMKLYRQSTAGDWGIPLAKIKEDLLLLAH
jgi:tetratricopeptide (TPR) repeat protein